MSSWSAENASKAYLSTLEMEKRPKATNIDVAEFISALAAGNNSKVMVVACGGSATSPILALVAAAHHTGGRVICILPSVKYLNSSCLFLGNSLPSVEFVIGEARDLILNEYVEADFVLVDCCLENVEEVLRGLNNSTKHKGGTILGYNAFKSSTLRLSGIKTKLLPIGEGLLVVMKREYMKSKWVTKVDYYTGEEHFFRIRSSKRK